MFNRQTFKIPVASYLSSGIAIQAAALNISMGMTEDSHLSENSVQVEMVKLLRVHLPSPDMIIQNKKMIDPDESGGFIPDIIVNNIGEGVWGIFEIKTLFVSDKLSVSEVRKDLEKLCAYKAKFESAAAVFVLVGSRSKLFNTHRHIAWEDLKISYDQDSFSGGKLKQQALDNGYVAIPCGSYDVGGFETVCFMWEIQPAGTPLKTLSSSFSYHARMIKNKGAVKRL